jgi:hypothetical protein
MCHMAPSWPLFAAQVRRTPRFACGMGRRGNFFLFLLHSSRNTRHPPSRNVVVVVGSSTWSKFKSLSSFIFSGPPSSTGCNPFRSLTRRRRCLIHMTTPTIVSANSMPPRILTPTVAPVGRGSSVPDAAGRIHTSSEAWAALEEQMSAVESMRLSGLFLAAISEEKEGGWTSSGGVVASLCYACREFWEEVVGGALAGKVGGFTVGGVGGAEETICGAFISKMHKERGAGVAYLGRTRGIHSSHRHFV